MKSKVQTLIGKYENSRRNTLNLITSENILSRDVLRALASSMAGRYSSEPQSYAGTRIFKEILQYTEDLSKDIFQCEGSSVISVSGHIAAMMVLDTLLSEGSAGEKKIATLSSEQDGGYKGYTKGYIPSFFGARVIYLPFDNERFSIKEEEVLSLIEREKPTLVVLGSTVFLFPPPVSKIADIVHSYGGNVLYDGSHVLGLIAGGRFQEPLKEGADILLGSTHKTLFGPQGGIILSKNPDLIKKIESRYLYRLMDNFHLNRVAALGVALEETKKHGIKYAGNVIDNAKTLAMELDKEALPVAAKSNGFTNSHQVLLKYNPERAAQVRDFLEKDRIIVDSRVRLGTNEVTRRGMGRKQMSEIAKLVSESVSGQGSLRGKGSVAYRASKLAKKYWKIHYVL